MTRTLIYAMQSSGASAYTFELGRNCSQRGKTLCIPDLWHPHLALCADGIDADFVIQKVVVTNRYTLDQHIAAFKPTEIILYERDADVTRNSLKHKTWANESGDMDFKFSLFESELARNRFPVVHCREMPWVEIKQHDLGNMVLNNSALSKWAHDEYMKSWGFGGIRTS